MADNKLPRRTFLAMSTGALAALVSGCYGGSGLPPLFPGEDPMETPEDLMEPPVEPPVDPTTGDNNPMMPRDITGDYELIEPTTRFQEPRGGGVILDRVDGDPDATTITVLTPFDQPRQWDSARFRLGLADDHVRQLFGDTLLQRLHELVRQV